MCEEMLKHGAGHTAVNPHEQRTTSSASTACACMPAASSGTQPSSLGGIGDIYNSIAPSLTLGCGSYGGNSVSGNVQAVESASTSSESREGTTTCSGSRSRQRRTSSRTPIKYLRDMYGIEQCRHRV
ncbi:MAG: hypothetical protein ACLUUF_03785 [Bifidobacterium pullorum]